MEVKERRRRLTNNKNTIIEVKERRRRLTNTKKYVNNNLIGFIIIIQTELSLL